MSERTEERPSDAEPRPEWHESASPSLTPFRDDAAFELENLRAGIAQVSALIPFVGPAVAFVANPRESFARREAAKAFNGQLAAVMASAVLAGPMVIVYFAIRAPGDLHNFVGIPLTVAAAAALWAIHAAIGAVSAFRGRDWTAPLTRVVRMEVLSEGSPDRTRGPRNGAPHDQ